MAEDYTYEIGEIISGEIEYPPQWVRDYIYANQDANLTAWGGTDVSFTVSSATESYGQGTYKLSANLVRESTVAAVGLSTDRNFAMTNLFNNEYNEWYHNTSYYTGWQTAPSSLTNPNFSIDLTPTLTITSDIPVVTIEFPEALQITKYQLWGANTNGTYAEHYLFGYDEGTGVYDLLNHSTDTLNNTSQTYNVNSAGKVYKKYAFTPSQPVYTQYITPELRFFGYVVRTTPSSLTFTDDILTIENSIDTNDTDPVSFVLPVGYEMSNLNVTNFSGTGTVSYTLSTDGATDITGTFTATGDNLLAGNPLVPGADTTYTLTLTADATITYTIVGTKSVDSGIITYGTPDWSTLSKTTIRPDVPIASARFGSSIAISGNYAIVGAFIDNKAYIFEKTGLGGWSQVSVLESSYSVNQFGYSVAIDGDYAIVGASTSAGPGVSPGYTYGSAHIFKRDGSGAWNEEVMLQPTDKLSSNTSYLRFGWSVAIDGDYVAIGAPINNFYSTSSGSAFGSAHVYKRDGAGDWNSFDDLVPFNSDFTDRTSGNTSFGMTIALQGDELFVGSGGTTNQGGSAVRIFKLNSAGDAFEPSQFISPEPDVGDGFSKYGLAVSGDYMIVGAVLDDYNNNSFIDTGAAYIYLRNDSGVWNEQKHLYGQDPVASDYFGWSVAIHGDFAMVGAKWKNSPSVGAAFVYERNGTNWTQIQYILGTGDQFGYSVAMDGDSWLVGEIYEDSGGVVYNYGPNIPIILNPTPLTFTDDILTIENSIDANDTDPVSFVLPVGYEMSNLNVTNFSGTGTVSYTLSTDGATDITGTFTATGDNLLAGNPLAPGADATYTLTLTADAAITYTIVGTKTVDYGILFISYDWSNLSEEIISADTPVHDARFGNTIDKSGNYMISSAPQKDSNKGAAYIFERNASGAWSQVQYLQPASLTSDAKFGGGLAIDGNYAVFGSTSMNSVYVYELENGVWTEKQTIVADTSWNTNSSFGINMSMNGDFFVVGSRSSSNIGGSQGSAHIYKRDGSGTWNEFGMVIPFKGSSGNWSDETTTGQLFGIRTKIQGDDLYVGAYGSGQVFVFKMNSGNTAFEPQQIITTSTANIDGYGMLDADGDHLIVGAFGGNDESAFIYERDSYGVWGNEVQILDHIPNTSDQFGYSVSISGTRAVVAGYGTSSNEGAAYIYEKQSGGGWTKIHDITPPSGSTGYVGVSTFIDHEYFMVGAYLGDTDGVAGGVVYSYKAFGSDEGIYLPTPLTFTDDILTIENSISQNDTDPVSFVLPAGYEMSNLNVTNFSGTGTVTYTLSTDGATDITGTFSASGTNLLSGNPILVIAADTTYILTLTADASITYTIMGTRLYTMSSSEYSISQLITAGYTQQQLLDGNFWIADDTANRFFPIYDDGLLDVSGGNMIVRDNFIMGTGNIDLSNVLIKQPSTFDADISVTNRLFVTGDVSMGTVGLNVAGDITIDGNLSVESYKDNSISPSAVKSDADGSITESNMTAIMNDSSYDKLQMNGDVSLNSTISTPGYSVTFETVANTVPDTTSSPSDAITLNTSNSKIITNSRQQYVGPGNHARIDNTGRLVGLVNSTGTISLSTNYGDNFTSIGSNGIGIAISADGTYICKVETTTGIHISTDEGSTWTNTYTNFSGISFLSYTGGDSGSSPILYVADVCISGNGQYICVIIAQNTNVLFSNDFGATWSSKFNVGPNAMYNSRMSISGQYICIHASYNGGQIWVSNDYGVTFLQNSSAPTGCWGMSMSSSGQYIYVKSNYCSKDYGVTWGSHSSSLRWGGWTGDKRFEGYAHSVWGPNGDIQVLMNMWSPRLFISVDGGATYNIGSTQIATSIGQADSYFGGTNRKVFSV